MVLYSLTLTSLTHFGQSVGPLFGLLEREKKKEEESNRVQNATLLRCTLARIFRGVQHFWQCSFNVKLLKKNHCYAFFLLPSFSLCRVCLVSTSSWGVNDLHQEIIQLWFGIGEKGWALTGFFSTFSTRLYFDRRCLEVNSNWFLPQRVSSQS